MYIVNSASGAVSGSGNIGSLPYVVGQANVDPNTAGSVITFEPTLFNPSSPQLIALAAPLSLTESAGPEIIDGPGTDAVAISGNISMAIFMIPSGVNATLSGMTITSGRSSSSGAIDNDGTLHIANCSLSNNENNGGVGGAAIYESSGANLSVTHADFKDNETTQAGGAIYVVSGSVTIASSVFENNSAASGAAIANQNGNIKLTSTVFKDNQAANSGGAISNAGGTLHASGCSLTSNVAPGSRGGGIFVGDGSVSLARCVFSENFAIYGGGIYVKSGTLTLDQGLMSQNTASSGGAIMNFGTLSIDDARFLKNEAFYNGGAIDDLASTGARILDCGFTRNSGLYGGAVAISKSGAAADTVTGCTFSANSGFRTGGGIFVGKGQLTLTNSTVATNSASTGGGAFLSILGVLTAINDTIADNHVPLDFDAGGIFSEGGNMYLYNTIVAQNTEGTYASDIIAPASTVTGSYNLIGTGGSGGLVNGQHGNQVGVANPGLATLADNGGPTETIALMAGSLALDNGSDSISGVTVPTIDQRGALRGPSGLNAGPAPDVGAFEASSSYLVTTTDDSFDVGTLRSAVGWANVSTNANPENLDISPPNTIVFDTQNVFNTPQTITLNEFLGPLELSGTGVPIAIDAPGPQLVAVSGDQLIGVFVVDDDVTATITGLTITDAFSTFGGGVSNIGNLTIDDCVLSNNSARGGGAISSVGTLYLVDSTLTGNSSDLDLGGAISNNGEMTILSSTLSGNSSAQSGGAISNYSSLMMTNVTIAGNTAAIDGGGIDQVGGTLEALYVTIAGNRVSAKAGTGGGLEIVGGSVSLYDTIVASNLNSSGGSFPSDISVSSPGTLTGAFDLIGTGGSGGLTNGLSGNIVGVANPGLGPLASNGGPAETMALLPGSPAIDSASVMVPVPAFPIIDERGAERGQFGVNAGPAPDIGAYEASSSYLVTSTADSFERGTLRTGVGWANVSTNSNPEQQSHPAPNTVFFALNGSTGPSEADTIEQTITLLPYLVRST